MISMPSIMNGACIISRYELKARMAPIPSVPWMTM